MLCDWEGPWWEWDQAPHAGAPLVVCGVDAHASSGGRISFGTQVRTGELRGCY